MSNVKKCQVSLGGKMKGLRSWNLHGGHIQERETTVEETKRITEDRAVRTFGPVHSR